MRAALIAPALAAVAAAAACSDPADAGAFGSETCFPGNLRWQDGPGCAVPFLPAAIDGSDTEWADTLAADIPQCADCLAGDVVTLQVGRWEGDLVAHLVTDGPPVTDGSLRYRLVFRRPGVDDDDAQREDVVEVVVDAAGALLVVNGWILSNVGVGAAFTPAGLEIRVPTRFLPFPGGAWTYTVVQQGNQFRSIPRSSYILCWTAMTAEGPCSGL